MQLDNHTGTYVRKWGEAACTIGIGQAEFMRNGIQILFLNVESRDRERQRDGSAFVAKWYVFRAQLLAR